MKRERMGRSERSIPLVRRWILLRRTLARRAEGVGGIGFRVTAVLRSLSSNCPATASGPTEYL
jgi:hypothetical protein